MILVVVAVSVLMIQVAWQFRTPPAERFAELQVYRGAVSSFLHGGSLYDYRRHNGDVFTYPPAAGLALAWIGALGPNALVVAWSAVTFAALVVLSVALTRQGTGAGESTRRAQVPVCRLAPLMLLFLLCSAPGRSDVEFGQISAVVVAMAAADLLIVPGHRSGWLLGAAIAIKLTPAVFLPYLWCSGRRRTALTAAGSAALRTAASSLVRPADSVRYWTHELIDGTRFVNATIPGNQSIRAALERAHTPATTACWLVLAALTVAVATLVGVRLDRTGRRTAADTSRASQIRRSAPERKIPALRSTFAGG